MGYVVKLGGTGDHMLSVDTLTLEQALHELARYGKVSVGQYKSNDGDWACTVKMHVTGVGVSFEVKSGYDQTTPLDAARVCLERVYQALKKLNETGVT